MKGSKFLLLAFGSVAIVAISPIVYGTATYPGSAFGQRFWDAGSDCQQAWPNIATTAMQVTKKIDNAVKTFENAGFRCSKTSKGAHCTAFETRGFFESYGWHIFVDADPTGTITGSRTSCSVHVL